MRKVDQAKYDEKRRHILEAAEGIGTTFPSLQPAKSYGGNCKSVNSNRKFYENRVSV